MIEVGRRNVVMEQRQRSISPREQRLARFKVIGSSGRARITPSASVEVALACRNLEEIRRKSHFGRRVFQQEGVAVEIYG